MFRIYVLIPFLFPCCRMGKPQWKPYIHGRMVPRNYSVTLVRLDMTSRTKNLLVKTGSHHEIEAVQWLEQTWPGDLKRCYTATSGDQQFDPAFCRVQEPFTQLWNQITMMFKLLLRLILLDNVFTFLVLFNIVRSVHPYSDVILLWQYKYLMLKISKWAKNKWDVLGLFGYILLQDFYVCGRNEWSMRL